MCIYRERDGARETSNMLFYTDTNKTESRQKKNVRISLHEQKQ